MLFLYCSRLPWQSQASVISVKVVKKSSIHKLEAESVDDSDQEN